MKLRRIKSHTGEKLVYIKKYLSAYLVATKRVPIRYYIDAFAGTGKCILCNEKCDSDYCLDSCLKGKMVDGSVLIALSDSNIFAKYFLCEFLKKNTETLSKIIAEGVDKKKIKRLEILQGDSNQMIPELISKFSGYASNLVLLDPEGPELKWTTIEALSTIRRADLLILYPYDMSLVRLTSDYKEKLDQVYGSKEWYNIYDQAPTIDERRLRLLKHYLSNLENLGFKFTTFKVIRSKYREGKPLYHFILASRNPVAKKIMEDIFRKDLDKQMRMKFKS